MKDMKRDLASGRFALSFVLSISLVLLLAGRVAAQTLTALYDFNYGSDGAYPYAGLVLSGSTLYGTALAGGNGFGTVFALNTHGSGFTTLYAFTNGSDGNRPYGQLILAGNTLYGTTQGGGTSHEGVVYAVNIDGTGFRTLHSFTGGSDGATPFAGLVLAGNTLYGTASGGSIAGVGTVFGLNTNGNGFVTLHGFTGGSDGANPFGGLILAGSTLYGTAQLGGSFSSGTVFSLSTNGTGFETLYSFTGKGDGDEPAATLTLSGHTLYGTTEYGGSAGSGTVFSLTTSGTGFATLYGFTGGSDGGEPCGGLVLSGNTLYGTAKLGGAQGNGAVYSLNNDGTGFTTLYSFADDTDGATPIGGLLLSGNTLFGTADQGGLAQVGTVFSLALPPPLALSITAAGTNLVLSWPTNSSNLILQYTTNLNSPVVWSPVTNAPVVINGQFVVTNPISSSLNAIYYQLLPPPLKLSLTVVGTNVVLSWPTNSTDLILQYTSSLNPPVVWTPVTNEPVISNEQNFVTNAIDSSLPAKFYELLPPPLVLSYTVVGTNVVLSWPTNSSNLVLQYTTNLSAPIAWSLVTNVPVIINGQYVVTVSINSSLHSIYYQLLPPPLKLAITFAGTNVILSWPTNSTDLILQYTSSLNPPAVWTPVTNAPVIINERYFVTNAIDSSLPAKFYELLPPPLVLSYMVVGTHVVLSWPTNSSNLVLQYTTNLSAPIAWSLVTNVPVIINGQYVVTVPINSALHSIYYQLLPPPLRLSMTRVGTNVVLTWPTNSFGLTLQSATSLNPPVIWSEVTNTQIVINGQFVVTDAINSSLTAKFYELRPPQLSIALIGTNVVLTWPTNTPGLILQYTTNLSSPAVWSAVTNVPAVVNGEFVLTNPINSSLHAVYYQLLPPQLSIALAGNSLVLTWPGNATGFSLQSTANLNSPVVWSAVAPAPVIVQGQFAVTNAVNSSLRALFYRLKR